MATCKIHSDDCRKRLSHVSQKKTLLVFANPPLLPASGSLLPPAGEAHEVHLQAAAVQVEGSGDRATAGPGHVPTPGGLATHRQPETRAHRGDEQTCSVRDVSMCIGGGVLVK